MIYFPNCKINLGLHILRKREDGYHDLETVFYPVPLRDSLEIIQTSGRDSEVLFTASGREIPLGGGENICVKAYRLLRKDFDLPAVQMHLHKVIPMGAGLGGGSANGAATLLLLNRKFNLQLSEDQLIAYALQLGSDCPFFIKNKPCFATGRGEQMEEIPLSLAAYKLVLVNPCIHVPTGWAFSQLTPAANRDSLKEIVQEPVARWKAKLVNDFEGPIFQHYPQIEQVKVALYNQGALFAAMTGSGSTVFGIFEKESAPSTVFPKNYFYQELEL